jgi:4-hydroxy-tetrahydrodipicolinate reductase
MTIRVLHVGLGPVGATIARQIAARNGFQLVGGIDIDPAKADRDLGEVIGLGRQIRIKVSLEPAKAIKSTRPHVVVLATGSTLKSVAPQIEQILKARVPIVSTTEELAYPTDRNRRLWKRLDDAARRAKVAVLGTGINPGFVMDVLPLVLTTPCERVDAIVVNRVMDARVRRLPFQQKIGAGLTPEQFKAQVADGSVRHVGFEQSIRMIADSVGWRLDRITEDITPKIADATVSSEFLAVDPGYVSGVVQDAVGYSKGKAVVRLHLEAYLGAPESSDSILIEGSPRLSVTVPGGIHGDTGTAAVIVNSIPRLLTAKPGLRTMRDLQTPSIHVDRRG